MVALAVLFAVLALAWMLFLPALVAGMVHTRTGFEVRIGSLYANPLTAEVRLQGLVVKNPSSFPRSDFIDVRACTLKARPISLLKKRLEVEDATVDVAEIAVVRDQHGQVNARLFEAGLAGSQAKAQASQGQATQKDDKTGAREFLIKHLLIRLDRLVVADYSLPGQPMVREYNLNLSHTYENVTNVGELVAPFASKVSGTPGVLEGLLPDLQKALRGAGQVLRRAGEKSEGLFESLEKRFKK